MIAPREAEQLSQYAALIRKWNKTVNLVSPSTLDDLETRHIFDSAQLADLSQAVTGRWLDIGSGGGLPGIPLAIKRSDLHVVLIDSDSRKVTFLRNCIRELGLSNCEAKISRIEQLEPQDVENLSARALAPLSSLLPMVFRHLSQSGKAWLMKGRNWQAEVEAARREWHFSLVVHPSVTDPDAAILEITELRHA